MRRAVPILLSFVALGLWTEATHAATAATIDVVKVDGSIDRVQAGYLWDQIAAAERARSTLVLQLDTGGTLDQDAVALAERIHEAAVPVIVWVGPAPAKAAGAGLLFMYAAGLAVVGPGSQTGPLTPLDLASDEVADAARLRETVSAWVADRGEGSREVVFPGQGLTAQEALDAGLAQAAAGSLEELLARDAHGRTIQTARGPVTLYTKPAERASDPQVLVRFHELGPVDRVLHAMASPSAIYLLLVLAFAALTFELTQPGFGFAGFSGVGMLALAVYGLTVVPFSWPGLAMLTGGTALMVLDVRVRKLGLFTVAGLGGFVVGSALLFAGVSSQIDPSPWLIGALAGASLLYYGFGLTVAVQSRERVTSTQRGLVGLAGEARGDLSPEGPVFVKGTMWRGRSSNGPIAKGARIRVRGVDGLILRVEADPEDPAGP